RAGRPGRPGPRPAAAAGGRAAARGDGPRGAGGGAAALHRRGHGPGNPGRLPKVPLMAEVFTTRRPVEVVDTDMAGIVHFSNFFRFMETAEVEFLRARGLSVRLVWRGQHLGFPRVAAACDYLRPVTFEDVLDVAVRVESVGRSSVTYAFE